MRYVPEIAGVASFVFNILFLYLWFKDHRPPVRTLTWRKVLDGIRKLKDKIQQDNLRPEIIVGIHTIGYGGGAVVGDVLGTHLRIPMQTVCVALGGSDESPRVFGVNAEMLKGRQVLLVDDVCTTGRTLKAVADELRAECEGLRIAVVVKPTTKLPLPIAVDFWAYETPYYVIDREWGAQPPTSP